MSDESVATINDDQSHYEISLTAGQAFVAFVLLLLSLAASFAFGLMIGKSQGDERLVVRKEPSVVTETTTTASAPAPVVTPAPAPAASATPAYAQILSTSDQKTAEALAAKLINGGFTAAFVERGKTDKGMIFRVRVKFPSEADAHASEGKLKEYSKEVWITK